MDFYSGSDIENKEADLEQLNMVDKFICFMQFNFEYIKDAANINVTISSDAAKCLKNYLSEIDVSRLFFPVTGSRYFAGQMNHSGMAVSSYEVELGKIRFNTATCCKNAQAIIDKFNHEENRDPSKTAMAIEWLDDLHSQSEGEGNPFWILIRLWFRIGGKKVLILSDALIGDELIASEPLKENGLSLSPVIPGFSADIYQGLEAKIGVCGVYEISKSGEARQNPIKESKASPVAVSIKSNEEEKSTDMDLLD